MLGGVPRRLHALVLGDAAPYRSNRTSMGVFIYGGAIFAIGGGLGNHAGFFWAFLEPGKAATVWGRWLWSANATQSKKC